MRLQTTLTLVSALGLGSSAMAVELTQLDDAQLSEVRGQDGVNLNLRNFSFKSESKFGIVPLTLTYTEPNPDDPLFRDPTKLVKYIEQGNISIQRSDAVDPFADPYQIQIENLTVPSQVRLASEAIDPANPDPSRALPEALQVIRVYNPKNLLGQEVWQMSHDWKVVQGAATDNTVSGLVHEMGSYAIKDMIIYGGGLDLAPAWSFKSANDVVGTAFGLDINMTIGGLILRPRGLSNGGTEMAFNNISIGRANSTLTGVDPDKTKAWRVADVIQQPGIISAVTDAAGNSSLQMGIEWYRGKDTDPARPESIGAFSVGNVSITNSAGTKDLGGMSVGGIQINYLNVNFRNVK